MNTYANYVFHYTGARRYDVECFARVTAADDGKMTPIQLSNSVLLENDLFSGMAEACVRFKSEEFEAEHETRIYRFGSPSIPMSYRSSRDDNYIIPYQILNLLNEPVEVAIAIGPQTGSRF